MSVFVDVEPRADARAIEIFTDDIREAVAQGVRDALEALAFAVSLTADEREALAKYRNNRAANMRRARAHVAKAVNAGKAR
jgi:hypothetical protein